MRSNKTQSLSPRLRLAALCIPILLLSIAGWACSARKLAAQDEVFLDEAFVALFPGLASRLVPGAEAFSGLSLAELESARQKAGDKSRVAPIIASPLVAVGANGTKPNIISPFLPARLASVSGINAIVYDYDSAYGALGARAGKAVSGRSRENAGKILCAVVFQPNSLRDAEVLEAFKKGYALSADPGSLAVEILEPASASVDPAGAADAAIRKAVSLKPAAILLALDDSARAVLAASGMKKIVRLGDLSSWQAGLQEPRVFEYWVKGNERAVADSALALKSALASGGRIPGLNNVPLPRRARFPRIF